MSRKFSDAIGQCVKIDPKYIFLLVQFTIRPLLLLTLRMGQYCQTYKQHDWAADELEPRVVIRLDHFKIRPFDRFPRSTNATICAIYEAFHSYATCMRYCSLWCGSKDIQ